MCSRPKPLPKKPSSPPCSLPMGLKRIHGTPEEYRLKCPWNRYFLNLHAGPCLINQPGREPSLHRLREAGLFHSQSFRGIGPYQFPDIAVYNQQRYHENDRHRKQENDRPRGNVIGEALQPLLHEPGSQRKSKN